MWDVRQGRGGREMDEVRVRRLRRLRSALERRRAWSAQQAAQGGRLWTLLARAARRLLGHAE